MDVLDAMSEDMGERVRVLRADGGASANDFLMQFQADMLGVDVVRPRVTETTALGAAMLAGRAVGLWNDGELRSIWQSEKVFSPKRDAVTVADCRRRWKKAVEKARRWAEEE